MRCFNLLGSNVKFSGANFYIYFVASLFLQNKRKCTKSIFQNLIGQPTREQMARQIIWINSYLPSHFDVLLTWGYGLCYSIPANPRLDNAEWAPSIINHLVCNRFFYLIELRPSYDKFMDAQEVWPHNFHMQSQFEKIWLTYFFSYFEVWFFYLNKNSNKILFLHIIYKVILNGMTQIHIK